jgi:hypothetical protein
MTSGYYAAFDYELFVKLGTTSSAAPTSTSGMTEVISLTNASMEGSSDSTDAPIDYSSEYGWKTPLITGIGWSTPAEMNLSLGSEGYRIIKRAWLNGASGTTLEVYRKSPVKDGSGDNPEFHAGVCFVEGFQESVQAGNVATVSFTMRGYGQLKWYPQGNPIATLTVVSGGSGLTPATYSGKTLISSDPAPGVGSGLASTADIIVAGGGAVSAAPTIIAGGTNYRVGDRLTVALADVGGSGSDVAPVFEVASVS